MTETESGVDARLQRLARISARVDFGGGYMQSADTSYSGGIIGRDSGEDSVQSAGISYSGGIIGRDSGEDSVQSVGISYSGGDARRHMLSQYMHGCGSGRIREIVYN